MFDIGLQEMIIIGVIALLVFGPSKLPELGRMFGRAMREFRRASDEFRSTVETNLHINDPDPYPSMATEAAPVSEPATASPVATAAASETAVETPPASAFEAASGEPFCARRGSRIFHRTECVWVRRIPEVDRVYFKVMADARDQGFQTCPVCEPWEPA